MDLSNKSVAVKSVDTLSWFPSNFQKGEPNEDTVTLSRLELLPDARSHFSMASLTVLRRLKQLGFLLRLLFNLFEISSVGLSNCQSKLFNLQNNPFGISHI